MAALSPHDPCEVVILKWSSQSAKTETLNNFVSYIIDQDPGPTLVVQPNQKPMGEAWSKDRLAPMLRDTPVLAGKVSGVKGKNSDNTIFHKKFPGGHLTIGGANSPAGLASRPIRYLLCDEINRWEKTKEGNALKLATKRTLTFWNRKILLVSSPTFEDAGIDAEYKNSLKHEWQLPCQHCGEYQFPQLRHFQWEKDKDGIPVNIRYVCEECGSVHDVNDQFKLKQQGKWIQKGKGNPARKGYWMNQWGSSLAEWAATIAEFLDAGKDPEKLQTVVNTAFAENWTGAGESIDPNVLYKRREKYNAQVPLDAIVLTCGVDVQPDRLELEFVGWGEGEESWGIQNQVIYGDTNQADVWDTLDAALLQSFEHESGAKINVLATGIDSGGHNTKMVYDFCRTRWARRVYAFKGVGGEGRPIVSSPNKQKNVSPGPPVRLFPIGVDQGKSSIYSRLTLTDPGPGYCHFPIADDYNEEFFNQLTAEKLVPKFVRGFLHHEWVKTRPRNEALDKRNYAYAALKILNPVWQSIKLERAEKLADPAKPAENPLLAGLPTGGDDGSPYLG